MKFLSLRLILIAVYFFALDAKSQRFSIPDPQPVGYPIVPSQVIGIGRDYTWTTGYQESFIKMLARNKINTTSIELAGWGFDGTKKGQTFLYRDGIEAIRPHYEELLKLCRKYDILLIVSIVNDNKGSGKYGDDFLGLWYYQEEADDAMNLVLEYGPEGVWVQTVAETFTPYGKQLEEKWIPIFRKAGFNVIYNRSARPLAPAFGANMFAYHPCNLSDYGPTGAIIIPDCGSAIGSYTEGGLNGATLKSDAIKSYARNVRIKGNRGLVIYTAWRLQVITPANVRALISGWNLQK